MKVTFFFFFFYPEVQLYLIILKQLGKWQEALELLKGPLGGKSFLLAFECFEIPYDF